MENEDDDIEPVADYRARREAERENRRADILRLRAAGYRVTEIARLVGEDHGTVSRTISAAASADLDARARAGRQSLPRGQQPMDNDTLRRQILGTGAMVKPDKVRLKNRLLGISDEGDEE